MPGEIRPMKPHDNAARIAYILHAPVNEPAGRGITAYMTKFSDVDIIQPVGKLPPFPKAIDEVNQRYMSDIYEPLVAPLITRTIEETKALNYGAICTASFGDIGVVQPRDNTLTPVVGLGWSNFQEAIAGWEKFSIIHPYTPDIVWYFDELVERYGMHDHCLSIETYDVSLGDYIEIGVKPDIDRVIEITMPCVQRAADKGARVILIGCGGQFWSWFAPVLSEVTAKAFHIPVLPPIDTMFSYARKVIHTALNPEGKKG
jgi:Asp/Glu/hydantoin racemase